MLLTPELLNTVYVLLAAVVGWYARHKGILAPNQGPNQPSPAPPRQPAIQPAITLLEQVGWQLLRQKLPNLPAQPPSDLQNAINSGLYRLVPRAEQPK